jgi:hypothetical protein
MACDRLFDSSVDWRLIGVLPIAVLEDVKQDWADVVEDDVYDD